MLNIILFIISFCLVIFSSYFFTAIIKSKRSENSVIFWILNIAAQIILTFEFLSLLKAIDLYNVLKVNFVVFVFSFIFWKIKNMPELKIKKFDLSFEIIKTEFQKDKLLLILGIFFLFSFLISLFLALYAPVNLWDSTTYHVARVFFWIQNKTLAHFETSSIRQTMFPPNAEIFYLWPLVFIKKDFLAGMVQFLSFCGSLWVLSSFLTYLKISPKRILWAIFVFASLPEIILQSSSTQNDLVLGFFLFASLYLFTYGIREKEKVSLIMSAVAMGIAMGIKGSAFMFLPAIGIIYTIISFRSEKKQFYKPLLFYGSCTFLFFILLSSYNYVLNYLEFRNPLGLESYMNFYMPPEKSIKSFIANLIRYGMSFIDFTGIEIAKILSLPFLFLKTMLFGIFHLNENQGLIYRDIDLLNIKIHENNAAYGPIGFLVFIPLIFRSGLKGVFSKTDKIKTISVVALIPLIFIPVLAMMLGFTMWNMRYFVTAMVISSPLFVLSYSYKLKPIKLIVFIISIVCFINISICNTLRPVFPINNISLLFSSREDVRYKTGFILDDFFKKQTDYLSKNAKNDAKIGLIFSDKMWYSHFFNKNSNWKIYPLRYELLTKEKLKNLDYIIVCNNQQIIFNFDKSKNYLKYNKIDFALFENFKLVYKSGINQSKHKKIPYESENPEIFYILKKYIEKN